MRIAANASIFRGEPTVFAQLERAIEAGFSGFEPMITDDGPLRPDADEADFRTLAARAQSANVALVGLVCATFFRMNYGSPEATLRQAAIDLTRRLLDLAAAAHVDTVLVIPAVVGRMADPRPQVGYLDAYNRTLDALSTLRHDAEARAVTLAIENVWNRFLLSPLDMMNLVDTVNSPYVGVYFDTGNIMPFGYPEDWIATLGRRIRRVHMKDYDLSRPGPAGFCPLGEGHVDWPAVCAALRAAHYDGPLTAEGPGEPRVLAERLRRIAAGEAPVAKEAS